MVITIKMLTNLKKRFNSALKNGISITNLFNGSYHHQASSDFSRIPRNVNVAAGCKLLAKYENDWECIHQNNEENGRKAAQLAKQIDYLEQNMIKQQVTISNFVRCIVSLPSIVQQLKACQATLIKLESLCQTVVTEFDKLKDLCEECELKELMCQKQIELTIYKQKKMDELELHRQQVVNKHLERMWQHEQEFKKMQKERQAVFEHEFHHDLEDFKQKGFLPGKEGNFPKDKITLEEIVLDVDDEQAKKALEEFLKE